MDRTELHQSCTSSAPSPHRTCFVPVPDHHQSRRRSLSSVVNSGFANHRRGHCKPKLSQKQRAMIQSAAADMCINIRPTAQVGALHLEKRAHQSRRRSQCVRFVFPVHASAIVCWSIPRAPRWLDSELFSCWKYGPKPDIEDRWMSRQRGVPLPSMLEMSTAQLL